MDSILLFMLFSVGSRLGYWPGRANGWPITVPQTCHSGECRNPGALVYNL